jgi:hypothetical protein
MKRAIILLSLLLGIAATCAAETLPITIWQKESRWQPSQGQVVKLNRGPFTLVLPLARGENMGLLAAEGKAPEPLEGFDPGHGMAGPYDGLFLSWDAFHYFHVDDDLPRAELWDREKNRYFWEAGKLYHNYGMGPAKEVSWDEVDDLNLIFRKDGFEDLTIRIHWVDY